MQFDVRLRMRLSLCQPNLLDLNLVVAELAQAELAGDFDVFYLAIEEVAGVVGFR
jgi:hypothetical protein